MMRKRSRQTSTHNTQKLDSDVRDKENDPFSQLPDDILEDIMNRLTLEQAARTSLVSSKWKYLWAFNNFLNFDSPRKWFKVEKTIKRTELEETRTEYISWVNKVLESHRGSNLNLFRIDFSLADHHKSSITNWIDIAMAKGVPHLELNLHQFLGWREKPYRFPQECFKRLRTPSGLCNIRLLKTLCLVNMDVSREILEFFIYNCPVLERLRVAKIRSQHLSGLKVVGSSIGLKYLELYSCSSINKIEISAPSLLSFKYHGPRVKLTVENVPQLVDVSIAGTDFVRLRGLVEPIAKYLPQLETLELVLNLDKDDLLFPFPKLPKLRHLLFSVAAHDSKNLLDLTLVMKACPLMQTFTLKLLHTARSRRRIIRHFPKWPYQQLKVVEFFGFEGHPIDLEFAFYLLENAVALEKMIVNPTSTSISSLGSDRDFEDTECKRAAARMRAKQLQEKVPQGVELGIH